MKTQYNEIVNVNCIGKTENPISMNDILAKAAAEGLKPASKNDERVLVIGIDIQNDFMDNGALGVPGAIGDVERLTQFIYKYLDQISKIAVSIDTHIPQQIFHPCWWVDADGNTVAPSTPITLADLDAGKYMPTINPKGTREYIENLEKGAKKTLMVWPYHCIQGTPGHSLDGQFANMVYFHSVAKKITAYPIVKGQDPMSEMYGIIKPEYDTKGYVNLKFLNMLKEYDKIFIAGEAKSHCVLESIKQILEWCAVESIDTLSKIYILEDCMSCVVVPGVDFEGMTNTAFDEFKSRYHVNIVNSTDDGLL